MPVMPERANAMPTSVGQAELLEDHQRDDNGATPPAMLSVEMEKPSPRMVGLCQT